MIPDSPPRRRRLPAFVTAIAVAAGGLMLPVGTARAAEGAAPAPVDYDVLTDLHTDAVSTFYEEGQLTLATKADMPTGDHERFEAESVWLHLDDDAKVTLPADQDVLPFVAAPGSQIWLAPQAQNYETLWPGFSTQSVPSGTFDGNTTTLTLENVDGPGDLELWTTGSFGASNRIWSSDEAGFREYVIGANVHAHANWAFTAAGTYALTVRADAAIGGAPQSDTATYTFVVGGLPEDVTTTTALAASTDSAVQGDEVTLDATVAPSSADGYVEFLDGTTVLGHEEVEGGVASLSTTALALGSRSLTARFVPAVANLADASTSAAVPVTVAEEGAEELFGIYGLAGSYAAGETIELRAGGATLEEGQRWRWLVREGEGQTEYTGVELQDTDRFTRDATVAFDGVQVSLEIIGADRKTVQQTAWHTVHVTGENIGWGESIELSPIETSYYRGDPAEVAVSHAPLDPGQTGRWVVRQTPYSLAWGETYEFNAPLGSNPYVLDPANLAYSEYAFEILDADATVLGRSAALSADVVDRELQVAGIQSVYRVGDTLKASSTLYPEREGVEYQWYLAPPAAAWQKIEGATSPSIELPVTAELEGVTLALEATDASTATPTAPGFVVGSSMTELRVSDVAPGEQLLLLDSLSGHYHQGGTIRLNAKADPLASDTDTYRWSWKRPDQADFVVIDGATDAGHEVRAQQALDGALVKAELLSAAGDVLATSGTVTIHVDDHGAAPAEKVTIAGLAHHYHSGDEVVLTANVAPDSVLSRWEWYVQKAGEQTPVLVEDENDAELAFAATAEYDGATVFARLTFDDGTAYVESAPVIISIDDHSAEPVQTVITVSGLADHYHSGDTMMLTASQDPESGEDHWHWFIKAADAADYSVIAGQATSTLTREVATADDGASIVAKLYGHDHAVIAESAPVVVSVDDHSEAPVEPGNPGDGSGESPGGQTPVAPTQPSEAPQARTGAELDGIAAGGISLSDTTVAQGQIVTVSLGAPNARAWVAAWMFSSPALLSGGWVQADANGDIAVRVPSDAEVGEHRLAVFAADGSVVGWAALTVSAADGVTPTGTLPATGGSLDAAWMGVPLLLLAAGAAAILIARRRRGETLPRA